MAHSGIVFALLAMVFWGFEELFLKESIAGLRSITTFIINTFSGLLLQVVIIFVFFRSGVSLISAPDFSFVLFTAVTVFLGYILFYYALEKQELSLVSALDESWIIISVIIGVIAFGETLTPLHILSILVILCGAFFISVDLPNLKTLRKLSFIAGSGYGALSVLFVGLSVPLEKILINRIGEANTIMYIGFLMIPMIFFAKFITREKFLKPSARLLKISVSSGFADSLGIVFYVLSVKSSPVSVVAPIIASSVVVALFLARIYLKEKMSRREIFGALMIILGIVVLSSLTEV